jgi:diguanylate cyclase (GGDEF)-like protein/PAS domain S-box-containing protein/putative nucleotidyltransferase with HDIG domain
VDESFYRNILFDSSMGYALFSVVLDDHGMGVDLRCVEVNAAFAQLFSLDESLFPGNKFSSLLPEVYEDEDRWVSSLYRVGRSGMSLRVVQHIGHIDKWLHVRASAPKSDMVVLFATDVTSEIERIKLLEGVVNLTPALLLVCDLAGKIIMVNDEWTESMGYPKSTLLGSDILEYVHPDDLQRTTEFVEGLQVHGEIKDFINQYRHIDGSYRTFEWRGFVSDKLIYGSATDITERLAEERKKSRELDLMSLFFDQSILGMQMMMFETPVDWKHVEDKESMMETIMATTRIVKVNKAFLEFSGLEEHMVLGKTISDIYPSESEHLRSMWWELLEQGKIDSEFETRKLDGTPVWLTGDYHCLYNSSNEIVGLFGMQLDISDRRLNEMELERSERRYRLIAEHASDVIWVFLFEERCFTYISPSVEQFIGYTPDEIMENPPAFSIHPDDVERTKRTLKRMVAEYAANPTAQNKWAFQVRHVNTNGSIIWSDVSVNFRHTTSGRIEAIGVSRDMTERRRNEQRILHLSYRDQLTGLYNRRYFEEQQKHLYRTKGNFPLSIIVCDVNGLKLTNDVFGHGVGDRLLIACAKALETHKDTPDILARIGGDEFVVLLPHTTNEEALEKAQRIQEEIAHKRVDKTLLSVSFGCATTEEPSVSFENLFKEAEDEMYRRKLTESAGYKQNVLMILIDSLYDKGLYEREHSQRVSELCYHLARRMHFSGAEAEELRLAGLLHDIGKIGIPTDLLNRKGPLSAKEWEQMQRHPEMGYQILRSVQNFGRVADWILVHHERPDGKGYPRGVEDEKIPLQAKIIAVANAFDSMTSSSGYRENPLGFTEALDELDRCLGTQFDKDVVEVFRQLPLEDLLKSAPVKEVVLDGRLRTK